MGVTAVLVRMAEAALVGTKVAVVCFLLTPHNLVFFYSYCFFAVAAIKVDFFLFCWFLFYCCMLLEQCLYINTSSSGCGSM